MVQNVQFVIEKKLRRPRPQDVVNAFINTLRVLPYKKLESVVVTMYAGSAESSYTHSFEHDIPWKEFIKNNKTRLDYHRDRMKKGLKENNVHVTVSYRAGDESQSNAVETSAVEYTFGTSCVILVSTNDSSIVSRLMNEWSHRWYTIKIENEDVDEAFV